MFAAQTRDSLVAEGQTRGVPIAAVLTPAEALSSDHFREVGALSEAVIAPGAAVTVPVGPFVVDGAHDGYRHRAPDAGADRPQWSARQSEPALPAAQVTDRPFDGVRILDLGVIVAGGELGRLFADLGAEVIKIESAAYPDGLRQTPPGKAMSRSWALTHRNEYSLGLDLRHQCGAELFGRLVAGADAVFANFKPGTLAALGFSYDRLREPQPRHRAGREQRVRGSRALERADGLRTTGAGHHRSHPLWTSCDAEPGTFYDATTIFPDHVVGQAHRDRHAGRDDPSRAHRSRCDTCTFRRPKRPSISSPTVYVAEAARAAGLPVDSDDGDPCGVPLRRRRRVVRHLAAERIGPGDGRRADRGRRATR